MSTFLHKKTAAKATVFLSKVSLGLTVPAATAVRTSTSVRKTALRRSIRARSLLRRAIPVTAARIIGVAVIVAVTVIPAVTAVIHMDIAATIAADTLITRITKIKHTLLSFSCI